MIFDPVRTRLVAIGAGTTSVLLTEVWEMPLTGSSNDWRPLNVPPGATPNGWVGFRVAYDPVLDAIFVDNGGEYESGQLDQMWRLSLSGTPQWARVSTGGGYRFRGSMIHDPVRNRLVTFAGRDYAWAADPNVQTHYFNDVLAMSLAGSPQWSTISPPGPSPSPRSGHVTIYDPVRDRMVVFGGFNLNNPTNDVWALSLASPAWTRLVPEGTPPPAMGNAAAIYDPVRDRMLIHGGGTRDVTGETQQFPWPGPEGDVSSDVWALSFAAGPQWERLSPSGAVPPALQVHSSTYDAANDRFVLLSNGDTHALSMGEGYWLDVASSFEWGTVSRTPAADCYGPGSVVSLQVDPTPGSSLDHWVSSHDGNIGNANPLQLTMNRHEAILPVFDHPVATLIATFEAARKDGAVELRWGFSSPTSVASWKIERADGSAGPWAPVSLEMRKESGLDVGVDRTAEPTAEQWYRLIATFRDGAQTTFGPVRAEAGGAPITASDVVLTGPNPARGSLRLDLAIARTGTVRLRVFDVTGREVAVLVQGTQPAGHYSAIWDGRGSHGRVAAGVYLMKLEAPDRSVALRFVLID